VKYCSAAAHRLEDLGRIDDLVSWWYTLVEMASGKLPWSGKDDKEAIAAEKIADDVNEKLMAGLPPELVRIWETISQYRYEDQPDYQLLRSILTDAINAHGIGLEDPFDWESLSSAVKKRLSVVSFDIAREENVEIHEVKEGCACCEVA
jgi:hypothetical protein